MHTRIVSREYSEQTGCDRTMFYRMAIYPGLRVSELKSITLADTHLDAAPPYLMLRAENEKARRGARQPLSDDLAAAIREYLDARLRHEQYLARQDDAPVPMALPLDAPPSAT